MALRMKEVIGMVLRKRLRKLVEAEEILILPGAYDALSAKLVQAAGFQAVYLTGYGQSASKLGEPDVGLMCMSEMAERTRDIAMAVDIPVACDADTGFGGPVNVIRTVREYERAGAAAIQLEDQTMPKKCGHMLGRQVVPAEEMAEKIRAAKLRYPLIVKPVSQGSSIGICTAGKEEELSAALAAALAFGDRAIVEEKLSDFTEVNCAAFARGGEIVVSETEQPLSAGDVLENRGHDPPHISRAGADGRGQSGLFGGRTAREGVHQRDQHRAGFARVLSLRTARHLRSRALDLADKRGRGKGRQKDGRRRLPLSRPHSLLRLRPRRKGGEEGSQGLRDNELRLAAGCGIIFLV